MLSMLSATAEHGPHVTPFFTSVQVVGSQLVAIGTVGPTVGASVVGASVGGGGDVHSHSASEEPAPMLLLHGMS